MQELVRRLSALDPDAGAGVKVIAYFDTLVERAASLEVFLRGAVVLTGCAAGLADPVRRLCMRVDARGQRDEPPGRRAPSPAWPSRAVAPGSAAVVWIERDGAPHAHDDLVLERLAMGARIAVERTHGAGDAALDDAAAVALLLDADAPLELRLRAAPRLGLAPGAHARVVASPGGEVPARPLPRSAIVATGCGAVRASVQIEAARVLPRRAGIGPLVTVAELPASWAAALLALRFTAAGSADDPGPPRLEAEELGALAALAVPIGEGIPAVAEAELRRIEALGASDPSALAALDALSRSESVRAAAAALHVHHSTMQARCQRLEEALGYSLHTPHGRTRAYVALALRRLRRNQFPVAPPDAAG
ncbi:MAG: helix-turn-helix domain-containing protein [Minicystis sp.]